MPGDSQKGQGHAISKNSYRAWHLFGNRFVRSRATRLCRRRSWRASRCRTCLRRAASRLRIRLLRVPALRLRSGWLLWPELVCWRCLHRRWSLVPWRLLSSGVWPAGMGTWASPIPARPGLLRTRACWRRLPRRGRFPRRRSPLSQRSNVQMERPAISKAGRFCFCE
jgi:hypothetical protein